jgi:hypothetical protein
MLVSHGETSPLSIEIAENDEHVTVFFFVLKRIHPSLWRSRSLSRFPLRGKLNTFRSFARLRPCLASLSRFRLRRNLNTLAEPSARFFL